MMAPASSGTSSKFIKIRALGVGGANSVGLGVTFGLNRSLWHRPSAVVGFSNQREIPEFQPLNHLEYRRNLPHFQPEGKALFITFRLNGAQPIASGKSGRDFAAADRELERTSFGPTWLKGSVANSAGRSGKVIP